MLSAFQPTATPPRPSAIALEPIAVALSPLALPPLAAKALLPFAIVEPVPPNATELSPLAVDQPRPIAPAPLTTAPPIATDDEPVALLCAPIATVATLPFARVVSLFPILGPTTNPFLGSNAVPIYFAYPFSATPEGHPSLRPGPSTA